jgi:hypothetical protein
MAEWAKRFRKWHRWLAIPMLILVPISAVLKLSGQGSLMVAIPAWEQIQSLLILLLALTGGYLYLFRLISRRRRSKRRPPAELSRTA